MRSGRSSVSIFVCVTVANAQTRLAGPHASAAYVKRIVDGTGRGRPTASPDVVDRGRSDTGERERRSEHRDGLLVDVRGVFGLGLKLAI